MRFSNTLHLIKRAKGVQVVCTACDKDLTPASDSWKKAAALTEQPANELPGPYRTGQGLLLRQFCCPHCGALLDTELALPGEPFLEDRLFIGP
jgi:acetone carboxylase gamma subunit